MKTLKIIAGLIALLLILAIAGIAYIAVTFDPDAERARIIELVKEKTGRQLRIDGDFKLTFFPRLGVALGQVTLSDKPASAAQARAGARPAPFLKVDSARAALRIMPRHGQRSLGCYLHPMMLAVSANIGDWDAWDFHLAETRTHLAETDPVDQDIAQCLWHAGRLTVARDPLRGAEVLSMASTMWDRLGRADRRAACDALLEK